MPNQTLILVLSLVAGVVGTGLGGVIGVLFKKSGNKVMGRVLSFAGGVMVGVVAFEMLPEAVESAQTQITTFDKAGVLVAVSALLVGMLVIYGLNKLLDVIENIRDTHRSVEELHHETAILQANEQATAVETKTKVSTKSLLKAGVIMLLAIALHNFPEGMAISAPLASGGVKAWKTILLTALAGAATFLGAVIGWLIGGIGPLATGICMGIAGGAMLYVTFCEILPQAILMEDGRLPAVSMLVGIVCAMLFVFLF